MEGYGRDYAKNSNIPVEHLDYSYIKNCNNAKELEKIIKVLRSGDEGLYPDLIEFAEKKLETVNPKSKMLWKEKPAVKTSQLEKNQRDTLIQDMEEWMTSIAATDDHLKSKSMSKEAFDDVPASNKKDADASLKKSDNNAGKPPAPRSYSEWDKINIDEELAKVGNDNKDTKSVRKPTGLDDNELIMKANREKDKGNEAFKAGDYNEAIVYYDRSISLIPTAAAYNNRALAALRMKDYVKTIEDCTKVIEMEPRNSKAYLRRGIAKKERKELKSAKLDFETVLTFDPENKKAMELLKDLKDESSKEQSNTENEADINSKPKEKKKGRRMVITEVNEDTEYSDTINLRNEEKSQTDDVKSSIQSAGDSLTNHTTDDKQESDSPIIINENAISPKSEVIDEGITSTITKITNESTELSAMENDKSQDPIITPEPNYTPTVAVQPEPEIPEGILTIKDEGNLLYKNGQYGEALKKYSLAIDLLKKETRVNQTALASLLNNRAACHHRIGDCRNCIIDCSESLDIIPNAIKPLMRRAASYEILEKYRKAFLDYRSVNVIDRSNKNASDGISRVSRALRNIDGPKWRDIIDGNISSNVEENTGKAKITNNEIPSPKSDSNYTEEYYIQMKEKGNSYVKKGNYEEAIKSYTQCILVRPNEVAPYTNRALCYLKTSQAALAEADTETALKVDPSNVKALFRRALSRIALENYKEGIRDLNLLLKIEPSNVAARKELDKAKQKWLKEMHNSSQNENSTSNKKTTENISTKNKETTDKVSNKQQNIPRKRMQIEEINEDEDEVVPTEVLSEPTKFDTHRFKNSAKDRTKDKDYKNQSFKSNQQVPTHQEKHELRSGNPYEFLKAWETVRKTTNSTVDYARLLRQISPSSLVKVISNGLEADTLVSIIKTLLEQFKDSNDDILTSYEILKYLSKVPRFEMSLLFLSASEKLNIKQAFSNIVMANHPKVKTEDLTALRALYKV
ncbi:uncharacterized protein TRIADDRAFT_61052 [Trichoplax adhaerens]|uniref:RNA-polymerase II-associated protein 3-like C-terminal domain-containing protein n=1 Tax=Trichoplax adhaerens TaxID=10228 RepID=B3S9W8_TRIAD|nr:hypothetical protein TRIADDRAFT_61052 [Trichoplax adhaerens]EDV20339.1 hypothetical protein TRIADDRAFT_61052 [Trichoplax adhaerens]|eukprot:XP_002117033.1 hypothetical protein TRIADDRAFT_61052 [Trichoplax adhaerens]